MASLVFKPQFFNFPKPGTLPTTLSSKLLQCFVCYLVHSALLFRYVGSYLFLLLNWKQCVFSGCGLPWIPTEPHRQEGLNRNHMWVEWMFDNEWRVTPPSVMVKFVVSTISAFYCSYLLGRLGFSARSLAVGASFSKQKQPYVLKSVFKYQNNEY